MTLCLAIFAMLWLVTAPVASAASDMTGSVMVTLAAVPGTWSPAPAALTYQWYSSGVANGIPDSSGSPF